MLHPCIICCKLGGGDPGSDNSSTPDDPNDDDEVKVKIREASPKSKVWTPHQFFRFLGRYLDLDNSDRGRGGGGQVRLEKAINVMDASKDGWICCEDCSKIVDTFCELYDQLKGIELRINHQVQRLEEVMLAADKVKGPRPDSWMKDKSYDVIRVFKRDLVCQCRQKLEASFPRLELVDIRKSKSQPAVPPTTSSQPFDGSPSLSGIDVNLDSDNSDEDYAPSPSPDGDANSEDGIELKTVHLDLNERDQLETKDDKVELQPSDPTTGDGYHREITKVAKSTFNRATGKHKCNFCSWEYTNRDAIHGHYFRFHSRSQGCKCGTCGQVFKLRSEYNQHRKTAHPPRVTFNCNVCKKIFRRESLLNKHRRVYHPQSEPDPQSQVKQEGDEVPAGSSRNQDDDNPELWSILDRTTGKYKCTKCPTQCTSRNYVISHYRVEHLSQRFHCSQCGQSYKSANARRLHQRSVHKGFRYNCSKCNKPFTCPKNLRNHQLYCGTGEVKVHPRQNCPICGKEISRHSIQMHMKRVHLKTRDHLCSHCGKGFVNSAVLRKHVDSVHLQIRKHLCDICGKRFKRNANLRIHRQSIHSTTV